MIEPTIRGPLGLGDWTLGVESRWSWTVGGLFGTSADWILARSDEARGLRNDLAMPVSELKRLNGELTSMCEASEC